MTEIKYNFDELINTIFETHSILQKSAQHAINQKLTLRNWLVGYYIVEYEQGGEDRAKYGDRLIDELSRKLRERSLKGFTATSLRMYRKFYMHYPQIQSAIAIEIQSTPLRQINHQVSIQQTVSVELKPDFVIEPEILLSKLSYSHFLELLRVDIPVRRLFYEVESIKNNWSVRELERAIDTMLCERTGFSMNMDAVVANFRNVKPTLNAEILKNPLILEFLDLEEKTVYTESDLEQSIITHLQKFLMEMGRGFCFEARQKRITFDNLHYKIDLVFYHRILKCHVLVDLKIGAFTHADAGQMTMYLNYFALEEMAEGDNPPIGIILCANKKDSLVKYATANMNDQLFVTKYMLELPKQEELEAFIRKEFEQ